MVMLKVFLSVFDVLCGQISNTGIIVIVIVIVTFVMVDVLAYIVTDVSCAILGTSIQMLGLYLEICCDNYLIFSQSLFQIIYRFETVS
jgi:hypothetical protein